MHCDVYQRTVRSLRHPNLCEKFAKFDSPVCIIDRPCSKSVFLVGGFAASDWLYQNLKAAFASQGLNVSRPDSHVCVAPPVKATALTKLMIFQQQSCC